MFIPALSFVRLAGAVGAVRKLWFLLFNMGVAIAVGTVLGTATASLVFPRRRRRGRRGVAGAYKPRGDERESLRKVVAAAAAFGNMANLPLVLVSALCSGESARTVLFSSSPSGPPSRAQCSATAEEYVMAPIAVASVMQVGRRGFEGKGREREREKRERKREEESKGSVETKEEREKKLPLSLCSLRAFFLPSNTHKQKQTVHARRGDSAREGPAEREGRSDEASLGEGSKNSTRSNDSGSPSARLLRRARAAPQGPGGGWIRRRSWGRRRRKRGGEEAAGKGGGVESAATEAPPVALCR